ncbi:thiamine transporter membrane protein [Serratia symbiotica str. 'Cinara cedri']|nr:thiamine transporter membrane protein [Serratia symbiotica str. 'Cinara cedri']
MANSRKQLVLNPWQPGLFAAGLILAVAIAALSSLLYYAPKNDWCHLWQDHYLWHVVRFTFWQALLSTILSVLPATLLARALYRRQFPAKQWLLRIFTMTLVLPVLVAVFGILSVYGRHGWLAMLCDLLGLQYRFSPYGLQGILLAHIFFNLPLASQQILHALENIPVEQRQLAAQLGMNSWQQWRTIEWPAIQRQLLPSAALIFILCFTSFTTVLAMGGGPQATTLELAIYQALSYDYNLGRAALLALIQLICCMGPVLLSQQLSHKLPVGNTQTFQWHNSADSLWGRIGDNLLITIAILLLLPPLLAVVTNGINQTLISVLQQPKLWQALITSLYIAISASLLCVILTMMLLWSSRELKLRQRFRWGQTLEMSGMVILAMPGIVLATGFLLLLSHTLGLPKSPYALVIINNALIAMPYALKILEHPMCDLAERYNTLCLSLGIYGWQRLRLIELKALRQPLAQTLAFASAISIGDLGVVALFGTMHFNTLPFYLYQQMAAYRSQDSAVTALLLLLLCFLLFTVIERFPKHFRRKNTI